MLNEKLKLVTALGVAMSVTAPTSVFASNGMFLIGQSTKSRAMGGVSLTMTHDTLTSASNPATMAHTGNRFDMGAEIFTPTAEATLGADAQRLTVESVPEYATIADGVYMMPNLGVSWNDGDISYGFTMAAVGGGGSRYDTNLYNNVTGTASTQSPLGVSLFIMNINPTIAMKLDSQNSVGATLIIGIQVFKAMGLSEFSTFTVSQTGDKLFGNGIDTSYGAGVRLGWLGNYMQGDLKVGASYTSQTYMSAFDDYSELFAEQGQINTPGNIGLGIAYKFMDDFTLAMDINYIMYEDVAAISNIGPNISGLEFPVDRATNSLGADGGMGFGWTNQTVFKLGAVYEYTDRLTLRGGWNYAESPINEDREIIFNIVAPATVQHHLTLGATYKYDTDIELSFSYVHAFEYTQSGPTYIGESGEISMSQDSIGATFAMKF